MRKRRFGCVFEGKPEEMAEDVRSSTPESVLMKENEKNRDLKGEEKNFRKRDNSPAKNTKMCAERAENKEQKKDNLKTLPSYKIGQ